MKLRQKVEPARGMIYPQSYTLDQPVREQPAWVDRFEPAQCAYCWRAMLPSRDEFCSSGCCDAYHAELNKSGEQR